MNRHVAIEKEQWGKVRALFDALVDQPPAERERILSSGVHGADIVAETRSLLAAADGASGFMEASATLLPPDQREASYQSLPAGSRVGAFRVENLIGRGGQGEVYRATRTEGGFEQVVALKLLRPEAEAQFQRFLHERQILANFEHPGIARLIDGGTAPDGRPYLAMEFVDGVPITDYCQNHALRLEERLALFRQVCDAVSYAHRNLIVHRDLKPANVLVTLDDQVKLLDFGISHALTQTGQSLLTQIVLTPDYAAPEQFEGRRPTTATDTYALGALLFHLLTGRPPFQLAESAFAGALRVMQDVAPLPSQAAAQGASPVPAERLRGDLDIIIRKALRYEAAERYDSVDALSEDIARFLRVEPIAARRGDRLYRARRFLRRNRLPLIAAGFVLFALGAGIGGIAWQARKTEIARQGAIGENERTAGLRDGFLLMLRAASTAGGPGFASARQVLDATTSQLRKEGDASAPTLLRTLGELYAEIGDLRAGAGLMQRYAELPSVKADPARLAAARLAQASLHAQLGERELAQRQLDETRAYWNRDPSRHPRELAEAAGIEAALLRESGRRDEAMQRLREAIASMTALFGPFAAELATLHHNLAVHALEAGRNEEAERAVEITEKILAASGRARSSVAVSTLGHRAALALRRGDVAGAEAKWRQAVALQQSAYGPSLGLAAMQLNLGRLLIANGRPDEGRPILVEALSVAAPLAGETSPVTIVLRQSLATGLLIAGWVDEARAEIERALRAAREGFGDRHIYVGLGLGVRSQIALAGGDVAGARRDLAAAEERLREAGAAAAQHLAELQPMHQLIEEAAQAKPAPQP